MNIEILKRTGFSNYSVTDFKKKDITLRDGRKAILWVHQQNGHGILDPEFWVVDEHYYEQEYRQEFSASIDGSYNQSIEHLAIYKKLNQRQFEQFSQYLTKDTNFLEVGCSFGGITAQVDKAGVNQCHAIEPNKADATFVSNALNDVTIDNLLLEDTRFQYDNYDIVVSFEVMEHVISPHSFITKISKLLKNQGRVNIEVPNHDDVLLHYVNSCYNDFYYHKAHIHYFTKKSLNDLFSSLGFVGEVKSFLMYPFFNHVSWHQNKKPQPSAMQALSLPQPIAETSPSKDAINNFYYQTEKRYEEIINKNMVGDCLIYQGVKSME